MQHLHAAASTGCCYRTAATPSCSSATGCPAPACLRQQASRCSTSPRLQPPCGAGRSPAPTRPVSLFSQTARSSVAAVGAGGGAGDPAAAAAALGGVANGSRAAAAPARNQTELQALISAIPFTKLAIWGVVALLASQLQDFAGVSGA